MITVGKIRWLFKKVKQILAKRRAKKAKKTSKTAAKKVKAETFYGLGKKEEIDK